MSGSFIEEVDAKSQLVGSNKLEILLFSLGTEEVFGINVFKIKEVTLEYIKKPRLVNSILNRMTDVTITDEILDIATTNLSGILENPTYQINKQQEQFNN